VKYAKSLLFVAVAVAMFIQSTVADGLSLSDWAGAGGVLVAGIGVYVTPNVRNAGVLAYAKGAVAVGGAICAGLVLALTNNNLSDVEVYTIFIAAAGALGVIVTPNIGNPVAVALPTDADA
jgi:hypothetical protein